MHFSQRDAYYTRKYLRKRDNVGTFKHLNAEGKEKRKKNTRLLVNRCTPPILWIEQNHVT